MGYSDDLLTTTPLGYWPCNDNGSGNTLADLSGNGHDLTKSSFAVPCTFTLDPDLGDYAATGLYLYDSSGDQIRFESSTVGLDLGLPWSVSFWQKPQPGNYDDLNPLAYPDGTFAGNVLVYDGSTTNTALGAAAPAHIAPPEVQASTQGGLAYAYGDLAKTWIGEWTHLFAEFDGTTARVYIDGTLVGSDAGTLGALGAVVLMVDFLGFMAHVAVWDRVLTSGEKALIGSFPGPPPPPSVGTWDDFDRADGALGTASVVATNWVAENGTWAIASNRCDPTALAGGFALARLPGPGTGHVPTAAKVTINPPTAGTWSVGFIPAAQAPPFVGGLFGVGLWIGNSGAVSLRTFEDDGGGTILDSFGSVDVSAGDHELIVTLTESGSNVIYTAWWDGVWIGEATAAAPQLGTGLAVYTQDATAVFDDVGANYPDVEVPSVPAPALTGGVLNWPYDPDVIAVPSVPAPLLTGGVLPWPTQALQPIYPPSVPAPPLIGGVHATWTDDPDPPDEPGPDDTPWPPGYQPGPPSAILRPDGFPFRLQATCQPRMNDAGTGSFTTLPPGPNLGDVITYRSGGSAVFTGVADTVETVVADPGEESSQVVNVTTPDKLAVDWGDSIVFPDFGAGDPIRVGAPAQDERVWGWPMNGLDVPGLTWTTSVGGDNSRYGTEDEVFPLPDNWPDNRARWMWTTEVDTLSQPAGWSFFRLPFGTYPGDYTLFVCAYDYARVWMDGVPVATVEQAGTTVRVDDLHFDWDYHLCAIEAYAQGGGRAGVLLSLLQRNATGFGGTDCWSQAGWKALERPTVSLRAPVGKVLRRLVTEAGARGEPAGQWSCSFSDTHDSAGRPWPQGAAAPLLVTKVGATMWDVLKQFADALLDFYPDPSGSTLHAFVKDGVGSSLSMPWGHAVDEHSAESIVERVSGH